MNQQKYSFTVFLGAISALAPLAIDMGLPGLPAIEARFADAAGRGPLTISLFMIGFAVAPLIGGPLADRFGRRPTLLAGLSVFSAAAAACAAATSFNMLLAFRLVQGLAAGACSVVPFAIVRDVFHGSVARNRLSQVAAVLGIAPMVAPVLGAWVMAASDWRMIYGTQAVCGILPLSVAAISLAETLPAGQSRPIGPRHLLVGYRKILSDGGFASFALVYGLGFGCMFSYIAGSPGVLMGSLGVPAKTFSYLFAIAAAGVMLGSMLSARLARRHVPSRRIVTAGLAAMIVGAVAALALAATGSVHIMTLMPLVALVVFCFGLIGPSANHEAMQNFPHMAGAASGVLRCTQMMMGAAASAAIALLKPFGHPALVMTSLMAGSVVAAATIFALRLRTERARALTQETDRAG